MAKRVTFYGVRKGREVGIFYSWTDCAKSVQGFSGAEFKGFATEAEAKLYLDGEELSSSRGAKRSCHGFIVGGEHVSDLYLAQDEARRRGVAYEAYATDSLKEMEKYNPSPETVTVPETEACVEIYTDGSFKEGIAGAAFIAVSGDKVIGKGGCTAPDKYGAGNVYGETLAVVKALQWARKNNVEKITIFHDYVGVAAWVTPHLTKPGKTAWAAKEAVSKNYQQAYFKFSEGLEVSFVKVAAHTGDKYNEMADQLAKEYASRR